MEGKMALKPTIDSNTCSNRKITTALNYKTNDLKIVLIWHGLKAFRPQP